MLEVTLGMVCFLVVLQSVALIWQNKQSRVDTIKIAESAFVALRAVSAQDLSAGKIAEMRADAHIKMLQDQIKRETAKQEQEEVEEEKEIELYDETTGRKRRLEPITFT
jgi:uncharacterized membrane protein